MTLLAQLQASVLGKVLFIGVLILTLLVPLTMIESLIAERAQRYQGARAEIARNWGQAQTIGGPIFVLPYRYKTQSFGQSIKGSDELYVLPEDLAIDGDATVETLKRGIYEVPVYSADLRITGRISVPDLSTRYDDLEILWDRAEIALPVSDARSIRERVELASDGAATAFESGAPRVAGFGPLLVARYAELGRGALSAPLPFSVRIKLGGTGSLSFLPLGDMTQVSLKSNWPSPSFSGAYLPEQREVTGDGFTASWRVLAVGRNFPSSWRRSDGAVEVSSTFGAQLAVPVGVHDAALRSAKYGVLLIGLTFAAYFLFELFAPLRLHALQYLLIGCANCVFYLLLLALAEHAGFGVAYLASAAASTLLIVAYTAAVLRSARRAVPIAALLGATYSYLYVTVRAEAYALLLGALGTFAALAAFMYATRRVDWHRLGGTPRGADEGNASAALPAGAHT
jgi:inner membrane protein